MSVFEISIIVLLYLIWGQRSEFVRNLSRNLTRFRRQVVRKITGKGWKF